MKIYVSPHYRTSMWSCAIGGAFLTILYFYYGCHSIESIIRMFTVDLLATLYMILFPTVLWLVLFLIVWRWLIHSRISEKGYQSYLGRRKLCYVDKDKEIYYTTFGWPMDSKRNVYIAFSNEPFEAKFRLTGWSSFPEKYDVKKIIVLPYYVETEKFFEVSKWNKLEMYYERKKWKRKRK